MWHVLRVIIVTCVWLPAATEAAPRKKGPPSDPFKACDVQVREDLREGGTWLIPQNVQVDEARLTMSVTFPSGQSIKSVPRFLRGNTDEEKRRQLRGYLDEMKTAVDAAKKEQAWLIVASKRTLSPDVRAGDGENTSRWYGVLLADIWGKCRSVAFFRNINPDQLPPEAQQDLKD
jgi:hypothetical protein